MNFVDFGTIVFAGLFGLFVLLGTAAFTAWAWTVSAINSGTVRACAAHGEAGRLCGKPAKAVADFGNGVWVSLCAGCWSEGRAWRLDAANARESGQPVQGGESDAADVHSG